MLFNLFQVLGHCLEMNIKGKTLCDSGMISSIVFLIFMLLVSVILPVQVLKNKNSKYVIPDWQNEQYEKIVNRFHI